MPRVIGVDPGTGKAGYAVLEADGSVLAQGIEPIESLPARLSGVAREYGADALAVGRGTNSAAVIRSLEALGLPVHRIDEYETTRFARALYFSEHPPGGWRRWLPVSLQVPPRPVDDYAAILIARRYLDGQGRAAGPA